MKKLYLLSIITLVIMLTLSRLTSGQVLNPNDSVYTYDANHPPTTPPWDSIGKWVRTKEMNWNTNQYKAYYYRGMQFRLLFPKSWTPTTTKTYPMVIFLHGFGERGTIYDNELQLKWEGQTFLNAVNNGQFDGFVLYPQNTAGFWGANLYQNILDIINYMAANSKLNLNKVYLSGLSAGGDGDWDMLTGWPDYFACAEIISSCPIQLLSQVNSTIKYVPVWISQGGLDGSPAPATTQQIVDSLNSVGAPITYTVYPNYGHGVWDVHYAEPDAFPYYNRADKTNPVVFYGKTLFCPSDTNNIHVTLALSPGFNGYKWRKNGVVISGATSNTLTVTSLGTYDASIERGSTWSYWSPTPVVIGIKPPTQTPNIQVKGLMSDVIPAPDSSKSVTLTLPSGYASYQWFAQGSSTVLSSQQDFTTSTPGSYVAEVTEFGGCSSNPSAPFTVVSSNGPNPPDPASNPVGYALSQTQIKLTWSNNPAPVHNETGFEIYRSTSQNSGYQLISVTPADTLDYVDDSLQANTKYYYIIRAIDSTGAAAATSPISILTQVDKTPPTAPTLSVITTAKTNITVSWTGATDNVGISKYFIFINGAKSYVTPDTSFVISNLQHDSTYAIYVKAVDPTGNISTPSNQVSATAAYSGLDYSYYTDPTQSWNKLPDFNSLTPVATGHVANVNLSPATQSTYYALKWTGYINIPVTGSYTFYTASDDGSKLYIDTPYSYTATALVNNDGAHGTITKYGTASLTAGLHLITVTYFQAGGGANMTIYWKSSAAGINNQTIIPDSAFIEKVPAAGTAPTAPDNIKATAVSYKQINVSWTDNSNNETGFEIYRSTSLNSPFNIIATTAANTTTYSDSSLNPSTTYYYKVQAINKYGSSGFNQTDLSGLQYQYYKGSWSTLPNFSSLTPVASGNTPNVNLSPTTQSTNYGFMWTGYINIPVTGNYTFYTTSDDGSKLYIDTPYSYAATALVNNDGAHASTQRSGTINNLSAGKHLITVTYFQAGGGAAMTIGWMNTAAGINSPNGIPDSVFNNPNMYATTFSAPPTPGAPTNVVASATSPNSVQLTWQGDSAHTTQYDIYRSISNNSSYQLLANVAASGKTNNSYFDSSLYANTIYYYQIKAENILDSTSAYSNADSALTGDHPPVVEALSNVVMRYDTTATVNIVSSDQDGDKITLSVANLPSFASFTDYGDGTGLITFAPTSSDQRGPYSNIEVTAKDPYGGSSTQSFNLSVNDMYAPVLSTPSDVNMNVATTVSDTLSATLLNARDYAYFTAKGLPSFATLDTLNTTQAAIILKPGYADAGSYSVEITATDRYGSSATEFLNINVAFVNPTKNYYLNFAYSGDGQTLASSPWNNITSTNTSNLVDDQGQTSNVGLTLQPAQWNAYDQGAVTGNNSGVYPDSVMRGYYYFGIYGAPDSAQGQITGLDTSHTYTITFFGSSTFSNVSDNGYTVYRIGSKIDSIYVQNNTSRTVTFSKISPTSAGNIDFSVTKGASAPVGYINAMVISSSYDDGNPPITPQNFAVQDNNGNGVLLTWTNNQYNTAQGFEIYRSTSASGPFTLLDPNPQNGGDSKYIDSTVTGNTTYYYTMQAINNHGSSANTDTLSITTSPKNPAISSIGNVIIKYGDTDTVNFSAVADPTDTISLSATGLPSFATFSDLGNGQGRIIFAPVSQDMGTYNNLVITANTNHGGTASDTFNVIVKNKYLTTIDINFTDGVLLQSAPWNNLGLWGLSGANVANLVDNTNTPTGISLTNLDTWSGTFKAGDISYNTTGIYPDNVVEIYYYQSDNNSRRLQFNGLNPAKRYNFIFYGSSLFNPTTATIDYTTNYTIGSKTVSLNAYRNLNNTVQINGVQPDNSGSVTVSVQKGASSSNAILNAMVVEEYDSTNNTILPATNLTANNLSAGKVKLTWQDHAFNESGYTVWRALSATGTYTKIGTINTAGANSFVDSLVAGDTRYFYKVQAFNVSTVSDYSNIASTITPLYAVYMNFNAKEAPAGSPWNNTNHYPNNGDTYSNLLDANGNNTGITMSIPQNFESENNVGVVTGNNSGVFPDLVMQGEYYLDNGLDTVVMTLSNLNISMKYNLVFFGSLVGFGWNSVTIIKINNQITSLSVSYNSSQTAELDNISPDQNGQITIKMINAYGTQFAILGAMVMQAHDDYDNNGNLIYNQPNGTYMLREPQKFGENGKNNQLIIYPNPFHNVLHVAIPVRNGDGKYHVDMIDMSGKPVYTKSLGELPTGINNVTLNLSGQHLTDGAYIIKVSSANGDKARSEIVIRQ